MKIDHGSKLFLLAAALLIGFAVGQYNWILYLAIIILTLAIGYRYYQADKTNKK